MPFERLLIFIMLCCVFIFFFPSWLVYLSIKGNWSFHLNYCVNLLAITVKAIGISLGSWKLWFHPKFPSAIFKWKVCGVSGLLPVPNYVDTIQIMEDYFRSLCAANTIWAYTHAFTCICFGIATSINIFQDLMLNGFWISPSWIFQENLKLSLI